LLTAPNVPSASGGTWTGMRARLTGAAWIESARFDLLLLVFAPLVTLPIMAGFYFKIPALAAGGFLTLAFAHYASTVAFFLWEENRDYHRARWLAFFGVPFVIAVVCLLLQAYEVPLFIPFVVFFWNVFHVARQNCGILSLYRQRAGVSDPAQRAPANDAILAISFFLALWNIETHPDVAAVFDWVSTGFTFLVKFVAGVATAFFTARLALSLWRRPGSIGVPEGVFLAASLGFFYPYLFLRNSEGATIAMLLPHYVQYMALVWLLHRRKFGHPDSAGAPVFLRHVSSRLVLLIGLLFGVGFSFYLLRNFSATQGLNHWFVNLYLVIAVVHFYLDGLIWSFRQPHVRKTIGAFLLRRPAARRA
jgi:hypothetical protein